MDCWRLLVVAAAAIAAGAAAVLAEPGAERPQKICDLKNTCQCSPSLISCTCSGALQDLVVKAESFPDSSKETLTNFEVKDCSSLTLDKHSLKSASKLQLVHISKVKNVSLGPGVFGKLQILTVDYVGTLILHKGAFEEVHGLNMILITETQIPDLVEGILYNITSLQVLELNRVNISKIEKDAVLIHFKQTGSRAEILNSKIGRIENKGLQIGNGTSITVRDTEIQQAGSDSIRLGALNTIYMEGNIFHPEVDVAAANIAVKKSIDFSGNTLLNVDLANAAKLPKKHNETNFTLTRLVTLHSGNYLNCKCINSASTASDSLKENTCVHGCPESTVAKFFESCQKNPALSVKERLKALCPNTIDNMTITQTTNHYSTASPNNASGRISIYVLMPAAFLLFHLIL